MEHSANYQEWTDTRIGLEYSTWGDTVHYVPAAPFYVDGIYYDMNASSPIYRRTMVEALECGVYRGVRMYASSPPTEAELDWYVQTGLLDGQLL